MALDTFQKQGSAVHIGMPFRVWKTAPATISQGERQSLSGLCAIPLAIGVLPTITTTANFNRPENSPTVVTMAATGDTPIAWSITGGADAALFSVVEATGVVTWDSAPDYEDPQDANTDNVYVVELTATNDAGSDALTLNITVTDVNEDGALPQGPVFSPVLSPVNPPITILRALGLA